jgi:hypothetical protein
MASAYHNDVWESGGNIPRSFELGSMWKLCSASCSCLFILGGRVEWSVMQQVWWIPSHWNRFAPVRSSSLRFARTQNFPNRNQRNVKKPNDLDEEMLSPFFTSEIG